MSNSKLSILAVLAVVMVVAAVAVHIITNRQEPAPPASTFLIQGLNPDKVAEIVIEGDEKQVNLRRRGSGFVVGQKDDYPADAERINELLTDLLDIQTKDFITDNPQNHSDLGVSQDTARNIVRLLSADANTITGVIIGERGEAGDSYARLLGSDEVYLCGNIPWVRTAPMDYIERKLISAKKEDITSVTVTDPNGRSYTLTSEPNNSEITLDTPLPAGKKLAPAHRRVFNALTSLRFDDVMRQDSDKTEGLVFDRTYICNLEDSTRYILKLAKKDDKTYAQCSALFTDTEKIVIDPDKKDSDQELKRKEAKLLARDAAQKLNEKCKGWVYVLPSYKADNLTKPFEQILEVIEEKETEEEQTQQKQQKE